MQLFTSSGTPINYNNPYSLLIYTNSELFPESNMWTSGSWSKGYIFQSLCTQLKASLLGLQQHGAARFNGSESVIVAPASDTANLQINLYMFQNASYGILQDGGVQYNVRV